MIMDGSHTSTNTQNINHTSGTSESLLRQELEIVSEENKRLKRKIEQLVRENIDLRQALFELNTIHSNTKPFGNIPFDIKHTIFDFKKQAMIIEEPSITSDTKPKKSSHQRSGFHFKFELLVFMSPNPKNSKQK